MELRAIRNSGIMLANDLVFRAGFADSEFRHLAQRQNRRNHLQSAFLAIHPFQFYFGAKHHLSVSLDRFN
jgi:hypothetical protein